MQFTLGTLMSEATAIAGQRAEIAASRVSFYVNAAQLEVATRAPHMFTLGSSLFSTVTSQSSVALPTDFLSPLNLTNLGAADAWGNHAVRLVDPHEVDNASDGTANARSNRYAIAPPNLLLYPPADRAYSMQLRYYKTPADLVNLGDALSVGSVLWLPVLWKACEYLFSITMDVEREAYARDRYLSYMNSTPSDQALQYRSERST